jgi:hypothetical protein
MAGASVVATGRWNSGNLRQGAQQDLNYLQSQANGFSKSVMSSFTGIGAALGGMFAATAVIDFFKQSAQAAMEDEKSMVALATAMDNVGLSAQNAKAEGLIQSMMLQTGIADDQLRPAYQKLVTVTKDVAEAQGLLQTALDLSAAGYGELTATSKALSAAANGNFTALQRLKVPIDQGALAAKDFDAAVASLNKTVGGQAAAAAQTYAGQMSRITVAVGEAQEAIGYSLLSALDRMVGKMGGTGGVQEVILKSGDAIAEFIDGVAMTGDEVGRLVLQMARLTTFGLIPADRQFNTLDTTIGILKSQLALLVGPVVTLMMYLEDLGIINTETGDETRKMTSATVASAVAAGKAQGRIGDLADETENAGNKAWYATQSYLAFYESLVKGQQAARDFANTSGTVSSAIRQGAEMGGSPLWDQLRQKYGELKKAALDAGGGAGQAAEGMAVKWKAAAASVNADLDGLAVSFGGGGTVLAGGLVDAFSTRLEAFKGIVSAQMGIIKQAQDAIDSYSQSITDSIIGKVNFSTTDPTTGVPLTPEQIVQMILGDISNQQDAVAAIGQIATQIPPALTQQIMALPPDAAIALANYLAANPALMAQLTTAYIALAEFTKVTLGDPMGLAFAEVGGKSATQMISEAKGKISAAADSFSRWVASKLDTTITVTVNYRYNVGTPPTFGGVEGRAVGGSVSAGTPYLVGERGPELFVPGISGSIIPNGDLSSPGISSATGGNTYQITVNAGVGDPRAIGKSVVEAITLFERSSGPVFARA